MGGPAAPKNGTVSTPRQCDQIWHARLPPIAIDVQEEQAEISISVRNEGSIIPFEERDKIFQRFYRCPGSDRRAPGTGIGLAVVKRITEAHRGRAWVTSDHQAGTTFFITLPRMAQEK
jgi:two-component system sensor histidine kinase KdpD